MDPIQDQQPTSPSVNPVNQPTSVQSPPPKQHQEEHGTSIARTIVAILLLIFLPLIGLIFVWYLTKWPKLLKKLLLFLIVIFPILIILFSVVIIALRPNNSSNVSSNPEISANKFLNLNKPSKIQNDSKRRSNVTQILNSIGIYSRDNGGELPSGITSANLEISSNGADICAALLVEPYMQILPADPSLGQSDITECSADYKTGYFVVKNNDGTVTVSAPSAESDIEISITR